MNKLSDCLTKIKGKTNEKCHNIIIDKFVAIIVVRKQIFSKVSNVTDIVRLLFVLHLIRYF